MRPILIPGSTGYQPVPSGNLPDGAAILRERINPATSYVFSLSPRLRGERRREGNNPPRI